MIYKKLKLKIGKIKFVIKVSTLGLLVSTLGSLKNFTILLKNKFLFSLQHQIEHF